MERLKGEGVHDWLSQHLTAPWHGHQTVASELGNDIIANIKERWSQLESSVRLGVLFSLISLKKAQQLQLKDKCQELIDHACSDPDDWVRLVSQMLKEFPKDASLRFNVEQFADQAQLGSLLDELTSHISRDGIKFHPKEFAYLSESVCREGQGKDPATKAYPPLTGPSLQQHFNLRDSHVAIHTERAEKLRKMAEQAPPIVALASGSFPSVGAGAAGLATGVAPSTGVSTSGASLGNGGVSATATAAAASATGAASQIPAPLGPPGHPRPPTKSSSTGLFVRKPAGSFLRNNAPRPMPLVRNTSTSQLPLRSPRLDSPTTPRLNQKSSRIQILDIQQGNEIMQSMNDEKKRKEQAEQREKELKKEQRQQELEAKRQQDAEKKAQLLREKEEKKREREEAKKSKERQKLERDRQKHEKDQDHDQAQTGETRGAPDDDDEDDEEEASLSTLPARKKTRISSSNSRRGSRDDDDDNDYDNERPDRSGPISPVAPSISFGNLNHINQDDAQPTPAATHPPGGNDYSDSYFPQEQHAQQVQQAQQRPAISSVLSDNPTIFQDTNLLTTEDRAYIEAFLEGHSMKRPHENESLYQIVMNQKQVQDPSGRVMYETILIEMNFDTGEWKKIKRRRAKPHVPTASTTE
ncbi:Negative elongation factor A [Mortierella sp. AM989]|nr:Negative elongation factor A [Mortierella sp. AM989]